MYGRADGMPSFQLTVAVRAVNASCAVYVLVKSGLASNDENRLTTYPWLKLLKWILIYSWL